MKALFPFLVCVFVAATCPANPADFDASGRVEGIDFAILAQAWKTEVGELNWNGLCDISEPNDGVIDERDLSVLGDSWLLAQILLEIYSDGWGYLVDTITMEEEGYISFTVYEEQEPYYDPPELYAYASREGCYTELYNFTGVMLYYHPLLGWRVDCELTVDLDPVTARKLNGVMFMTQIYFADSYLADTDVNVLAVDTNTYDLFLVTSFHTDSQGRFAIDPLPAGEYFLEFYECDWGEECYHFEEVDIGGLYEDFAFPSCSQALKPNIYIYPEQTMELDVHLLFPRGGQVTTSIPEYEDGWHVTVEPSGLIDGRYEHLFYESVQPDYSQHTFGWVVAAEQLEDFFRTNLAQTGFIQKEADDFVEYWVPRLTGHAYYAIYPQYNAEFDKMIQLGFSTAPDNLIRVIYSIRGLDTDGLTLREPVTPAFTREGFTVAEWGVILD